MECSEIVPDHIEPRGMGAARRDGHSEHQAVHLLCNLDKGSRRLDPGQAFLVSAAHPPFSVKVRDCVELLNPSSCGSRTGHLNRPHPGGRADEPSPSLRSEQFTSGSSPPLAATQEVVCGDAH